PVVHSGHATARRRDLRVGPGGGRSGGRGDRGARRRAVPHRGAPRPNRQGARARVRCGPDRPRLRRHRPPLRHRRAAGGPVLRVDGHGPPGHRALPGEPRALHPRIGRGDRGDVHAHVLRRGAGGAPRHGRGGTPAGRRVSEGQLPAGRGRGLAPAGPQLPPRAGAGRANRPRRRGARRRRGLRPRGGGRGDRPDPRPRPCSRTRRPRSVRRTQPATAGRRCRRGDRRARARARRGQGAGGGTSGGDRCPAGAHACPGHPVTRRSSGGQPRAASDGPVVIAGGGIAGLATAALLAREGREVAVVERRSETGGRVGSWAAEGFRFDTGPSWYLMPEVFEHFFRLLGTTAAEQLDLVRLDPGYRVYFEGDTEPVDIHSDPAAAAALFESIETGAGRALHAYLDSARETYDLALRRFLYTDFRSLLPLMRRDVLARGGEMLLRLTQPLHTFVSRRFRDRRLRQILGY